MVAIFEYIDRWLLTLSLFPPNGQTISTLYNVLEIFECGGREFPGKESKVLEPTDQQRKDIASLKISFNQKIEVYHKKDHIRIIIILSQFTKFEVL